MRVTAPRPVVVRKLHGMASIVDAGRSTARDRHGPACRRQPNTGLGRWPMQEMASSRCPRNGGTTLARARRPARSRPGGSRMRVCQHAGCALQPLCYRPLEFRPGPFGSDAAGQRTQQQSRRVLSLGRIPAAMCSLQEATGQPRVSISPGQPICGAPRRNRTGDPILTIDAPVVHDAVRHLTSPHIHAGGRCCRRSCRGA